MGPKVSKAKRPKRRWIGISFPSDVESKQDLLRTIESSVLSDYNIKLYDMYIAASLVAKNTRQILDIEDEVGVAIICVLLSDYKDVRLCLASDALHEKPIAFSWRYHVASDFLSSKLDIWAV